MGYKSCGPWHLAPGSSLLSHLLSFPRCLLLACNKQNSASSIFSTAKPDKLLGKIKRELHIKKAAVYQILVCCVGRRGLEQSCIENAALQQYVQNSQPVTIVPRIHVYILHFHPAWFDTHLSTLLLYFPFLKNQFLNSQEVVGCPVSSHVLKLCAVPSRAIE